MALTKIERLKSAELWKEIEAAGCAYARDRTIAHADAFYEAVYGMRPGRE